MKIYLSIAIIILIVFAVCLVIALIIRLFGNSPVGKKRFSNCLELWWVIVGIIGLFLAAPVLVHTGSKAHMEESAARFDRYHNYLMERSKDLVNKYCHSSESPLPSLCKKHEEFQTAVSEVNINTDGEAIDLLYMSYKRLSRVSDGETRPLILIEELSQEMYAYHESAGIREDISDTLHNNNVLQGIWPFLLAVAFGIKLFRSIYAFYE